MTSGLRSRAETEPALLTAALCAASGLLASALRSRAESEPESLASALLRYHAESEAALTACLRSGLE